MKSVKTTAEIENSAKRAVQALYGTDITDFKVYLHSHMNTKEILGMFR